MTEFFGKFEYQMDGKGRVALPSAYRREADRFVLLQWEKPYLTLFPQSTWQEKQEELLELRKSGVEAARYVRELLSMTTEVVPDKQGRILVPAWLQEAASLGGSVLFVGNIDRIELWDPETFGTTHGAEIPPEVAGFVNRVLG